jgi:hypothetical protein
MKAPLVLSLAFASAVLAAPFACSGARADEEPAPADDAPTAQVMSMLAPEPERAEESPRLLTLTPALGFALSQPDALNSWLAGHTLNGDSISGQITWSTSASVALRYELTPYLALGLRVEYADVQCSRKVTFNDVSQGLSSELSWLTPSLTADFKFPS